MAMEGGSRRSTYSQTSLYISKPDIGDFRNPCGKVIIEAKKVDWGLLLEVVAPVGLVGRKYSPDFFIECPPLLDYMIPRVLSDKEHEKLINDLIILGFLVQ